MATAVCKISDAHGFAVISIILRLSRREWGVIHRFATVAVDGRGSTQFCKVGYRTQAVSGIDQHVHRVRIFAFAKLQIYTWVAMQTVGILEEGVCIVRV